MKLKTFSLSALVIALSSSGLAGMTFYVENQTDSNITLSGDTSITLSQGHGFTSVPAEKQFKICIGSCWFSKHTLGWDNTTQACKTPLSTSILAPLLGSLLDGTNWTRQSSHASDCLSNKAEPQLVISGSQSEGYTASFVGDLAIINSIDPIAF